MIWKDVNTNSKYQISDKGQVRIKKMGYLMTPQMDKDGYLYVRLYDNDTKKYTHKRLHRLVLENFDRMPKDGEECHHKDANRQNNCLENLCWVTRQENDSYVKHEMNSGSYPKKAVIQLSLDGKVLNYFESMSEASRQTGCNVSKISAVCRGARHTTGGYKWKLQNE